MRLPSCCEKHFSVVHSVRMSQQFLAKQSGTLMKGETTMQSREATMRWQVTCQCGWRGHGTQEEIIAAVQEHGRSAHALDISAEQVMALAAPLDEA